MAEVPFRPVCQLSEYKGKGASASREDLNISLLLSEGDIGLTIPTFRTDRELLACSKHSPGFFPALSLTLYYLNAWNRLTVNHTHGPYRSVHNP